MIRFATDKDIPAILPLMTKLGYSLNLNELTNQYNKFTNNDGYGIAVALEEGRIVGWVAWSKSELFVLNKTRLRIEGIVVDENYKGKGIGKKLMMFVEEFAKRFKPAVIELTSGLRREKDGSHKFYDSLGYKNEGHMAKLYLRKEL